MTDPVRLLRAWRALLAEHGITTGALLRTVNRHGQLGGAMSDAAVNGVAHRAGLPNTERYSARCLPAGGDDGLQGRRGRVAICAAQQVGAEQPGCPIIHPQR
jgi:hypothetical protein